MDTLSQAELEHKYSWWWDSHICPKNSRWLQENLADMDSNIKLMIKLIEEDADSFARRAEMYFKKRPELMKLVEEFYRAYRALAERYDHATGELRQAHRTISEAFPNQFPSLLLDDAPTSSASETDPRTPETATPAHGYFGTEDLEHDTVGPSLSCSHASKRNDAFSEHSDPVSSRNSPKHNSLFRSLGPKKSVKGKVRKGLKFYEVAKSELVSKLEKEILHSKEALVKLESEKEAGLKQYQRSLEHLSRQKAAVSRAEEDSQELTEQASKAETEIQALKKALFNLEAEKEVSLLQYQLCLEKISNLQDILSHAQKDAGDLDIRTNNAEADTRTLKQDLAKVEAEKDVVLNQYKQSLELTTNLEKKLLVAEERAQKYCERAEVAECEVQTLKVAISKLIEAKEAAALNYEKCLETISSLELKISSTHEDVQNLSGEIDSKVEKLLHSELKTLVLRMDTQDEELTEKQRELGKLWACIQEERLRFMEAEIAFQSLQLVHSQAQEDLSSLASELQSMAYILRNVETHNDSLQVERLKLKNENKSLNELNLSSTMSMKGIQNEIDRLKKTNRKFEEEVELQVDQRNSFQQEIYCLKEELRDLNHKHLGFSKQVDAVGLSQDCFETSVKELQDENSNLGILCQRERSDRVALSEKMEKLLNKNALLEISLLNMGDELEAARRKINVLEESCHSLLQEKSSVLDENASLMTQLQLTTENLGKHLEKNTILENTLCDTLDQLEVSEEKVKSLRDSCLLLANQKTGLISEKNTLVSQVEMMHQSLSNSEKRSIELEEKCSVMEKDRKSTTIEVKGLKNHLEMQKQEQLNFAQMSNTQLACLVHQVHLLQDEILNKYRELDGELGHALHYEVENFVLQRCVHDLRDKNSVLLIECQKLSETSKLSEKLISELEQENIEEHLEVKSLFDQHNSLMSQLSKAFYIVSDQCCEDLDRPEKTSVEYIISSVHDMKSSLSEAQDENQLLAVEMSVLVVLIDQLKLEASNIQMEKSIADHELRVRSEQCLMFESESRKLSKMTEELILKVMDGYHKEEELMTRMENLHGMLLVIQEAYDSLQKEKVRVVEEKQVLMKELLDMRKKNHTIEEEKHTINSDMFSLDILSLIFKKYVDERSTEMKKLCEDLHKLRGVNAALEKERRITEEKLDDLEVENLHLKEKLHESDSELRAVTSVVGKLNQDIANSKDLLCQKEMDLSEAEHDIIIRENENSCFTKEMENLRWEHDAVQMIREDLEKQMVKLREDSAHVLKENQCLGEAKQKFEVELNLLHGLYETSRNKENFLFSEVQKKNDEINLWQTQATTLYGELQTSIITRTLLEDKVNELIGKCNSLHDGNTMKDVKIELLGERIGILEGKNKGLKSQLVSLGPAMTSLMDTVSSLEVHTFMHKNIQEPGYEDIKEVELADQNIILPYALSNMQDLQARVKAIEKTIIEMARLATQENLNAYNKLESTAKQMEELRSENRSLKGKVQPISEISEASGVLPKDIMLDHISESSFYGTSRRHYVGPDNQMLELWETADENSSIDLSIGKGKKVVGAHTKNERFEAVKLKSETSSSNLLIEKELGMNILEISKKFRETRQEGNKRKVLERLNSDVQKLTNLRITVQDLKRKVATIEKSRNSKAITESDSVKQKLEDAEAAIQKLFDLNGKLVKNVEDNSTYSGKISSVDSGDSGSVRRKRISEQARRVSEKIGQLQLEIQRIQFDLLKVDDVKESIGKFRLTDTRRKVLLRDYIYTGPKNTPRRKKATFCACMEPPTKGD